MVKIYIKAKPGSKTEKLEDLGGNSFAIWVKEPAKENKANFAILERVAKHFGVGISRVRLVSGARSKDKIIEIENGT